MSGNSRSKTKLNVLDKVPFSELEALRVAIHRKNVTQTEPIPPFERKIDDPKTITAIVHSKKDSTRKSVFDREGVVVNQYDETVIKPRARSRSRSRSSSSSRRSSDRNRKSNNDKKSRHRSHSREKDRDWSKSPVRERERRKYSPERGRNDREKSVERRKDYNYNRDRDESYRGRSRSPQHYRRRSSSRGRDEERRRRSRSASRSRYIPPNARKSVSPKYHKSAYHKEPSRSPNRADKAKRFKYGEPSSRRSRSFEREKRERSRERHRFSRSPPGPLVRYDKERKKSRSPNRSPPRYDKYRRSRSPHRYDSYKEAMEKRSSRSPRKLSGSRPDYKHARSPDYERERRYRSARDRSKSRSPKPGIRSSAPHRSREIEYGYYEGYPGAELWLPGALPPGYPIPRFYPRPGPFFPRQPIVIPPQVPLPYQPYRPRYPIYNSKYNVKHSIQSEITSPQKSSTETNATGDGTVVVQEVDDDKSNKDGENEKEKGPDDGKG